VTPTGQRHDFPVRETRRIYRGRVMGLRADQVEMPGGRLATREIIEHPGRSPSRRWTSTTGSP